MFADTVFVHPRRRFVTQLLFYVSFGGRGLWPARHLAGVISSILLVFLKLFCALEAGDYSVLVRSYTDLSG